MKNSQLKKSLSFFILIIALNSSIACFRSKQSIQEETLATVTPSNFANRTSINRTLIEIASSRTCNKTVEPEKELVHCYHKGKCQSKLVPLNHTHYERVIFCLCAKVIFFFSIKFLRLDSIPCKSRENDSRSRNKFQDFGNFSLSF